MTEPRFSFVVPVYNGGEPVDRTIDGVDAQIGLIDGELSEALALFRGHRA